MNGGGGQNKREGWRFLLNLVNGGGGEVKINGGESEFQKIY